MRAVNAAREDALTIDVSGMDEFDIGDFATDLSDAEGFMKLNALRLRLLRKRGSKS